MKVLMIETFLPSNRYSLELAKPLQKITDLTLFSKTTAGPVDSGIRCERKLFAGDEKQNKILSAIAYFKGMAALRREIKSGYDVIHVQTFRHVKFEMQLYRKSKRKNQILAHTVHNILPHEAKASDRALYQSFYDTCDVLIVHNESTKRQLTNEFQIPVDKIHVIAHGIYGDMKKNTRCMADQTNFLMFGFIRKYKGVDILLKAVSLLPPAVREKCRFIIAGKQYPDKDPTDYQAMAEELQITSCVTFLLRRIEDEELPALFEDTDVCVFPYREIYGSGALLMAYTYQKPVIASNVPAFVEETENGKTGILFENEDPGSLAAAMETFVSSSEAQRRAFSSCIEELVHEKYNWAASARKTADAYQKALLSKEPA